MLAIFKFRWRSFIKSPSPFFILFFPLILLFILGNIMPIIQIGPGIVAASIFNISLFTFGISLVESKQTSVMKRIGVLPLDKKQYMAVLFLFSSVLTIGGALWTISWIALGNHFHWFAGPYITWSKVNIGGLILGIFYQTSLSLVVAIFIASFAKSTQGYQGLSQVYLFLASFLGGMYVANVFINGIDAMRYISYLIPHKYSAGLIIGSFDPNPAVLYADGNPSTPITAGGIFEFKFDYTGKHASIQNEANIIKVMNLVVPPFVTIGLFAASVKTFRWENDR